MNSINQKMNKKELAKNKVSYPNGWCIGIINLWDLPYNLTYIKLKDKFRLKFCKILLEIGKTKKYVSIYTKIPYDSLRNLFRGQAKSLEFFDKLINFLYIHNYFNINHELISKNIIQIGTRSGGKSIYNPKIPFDFNTPGGATLISAILHDGGIAKEPEIYPHYRNYNRDLRKNLIEKSILAVGDMDINLENTHPNFPKILGIILKHGIGISSGAKVFSNQHIPEFILKSSDEIKGVFLRQAFDDDGSVYLRKKDKGGRNISLKNTIDVSGLDRELRKNVKYSPNLLKGHKLLLESLGIKVKGPVLSRTYLAKGNKTRHAWMISLTFKKDFQIFKDKIGFLSKEKQERLKKICI